MRLKLESADVTALAVPFQYLSVPPTRLTRSFGGNGQAATCSFSRLDYSSTCPCALAFSFFVVT